MKFLMIAVASLVCAVTFGESAETAKTAATKSAATTGINRASKTSNGDNFRMRVSGGIVKKAGSAQGKVIFLNAQKRVSTEDIRPAVDEIGNRLHPEISIESINPVGVEAVGAAVRAAGAKIGVVIIDAEENGIPALLAAPEEGWAVVNVAKLAVGDISPDVLASRTRKEAMRAFALAGGAAFMGADPEVMRPDIRIPKDLDTIQTEMYGIDVSQALVKNMPYAGVKPWKVVTYRMACQEGWAPAPTNEYQKAIWDKVHAVPTKPLKLEK